MAMTDNHKELCERLRDQAIFDQKQWGARPGNYVPIAGEAADLIEQQAARIQQQALEYISLQAQCDEHVARIAELEADRDSWRDQASQRVADWDAMRKERDALIHDNAQSLKAATAEATLASEALAERDALKADAERYFFLKRQAKCDPKMDGRHVWYSIPMRNPNGGCLIGNTLDAAIDAAIQAEKETRS